MKRLALVLVLAALCGTLTFAQSQASSGNGQDSLVPHLVHFTGQVTDTNGKPLTGVLGITFFIYQEQQGGSPLWMETQNVLPNAAGRYTVTLGATQSTGLPVELFTSGGARWLGVQVQGQAEQPRVMLLSVPYALKAADAETVGGLPASAFVLAPPGGAKTVAPEVSSPASSARHASPAIAGSGTQNYIPLWTNSSGSLGNSMLFQTSGNVNVSSGDGITINGTQDGSGSALIPNQLFFQDNGEIASHDANHRLIFDRAHNILELREWGNIEFSPGSTGGRTDTVTVPAGGGITVVGDLREDFNGANKGGLTPGLRFGAGNTGEAISSDRAGGVNKYGIDFYTAFHPRLSITNGGSVGISTTTPAANLEVNGTGKFDGLVTFASGQTFPGTAGLGVNTFTGNQTINGDLTVTGIGATVSASGGATGLLGGGSTYGVEGYSSTGDGVIGSTTGSSQIGVCGLSGSGLSCPSFSAGTGVYGTASSYGTGVIGASTSGTGVSGGSSSGAGVVGTSGSGSGVLGEALGGDGVYGVSESGTGVCGFSTSQSFTCDSGYGIYGYSSYGGTASGVYGAGTTGVWGSSSAVGSAAVYGENNTAGGFGVWGWSSGGYAGYFSGNIKVTGSITAGTKDFEIDHPLDPANKYLVHASVESSEMMNIYTGNVILDDHGTAWITLPDYFEALNRDFRYQLTAIGAPGPNLYIAQEIANNRFQIAGGMPGGKVSWQVTGIRHDAFARAHPIIPEVEKTGEERGKYLHPVENGQPKSLGIDESRRAKSHPRQPAESRQRAAVQEPPVPQRPPLQAAVPQPRQLEPPKLPPQLPVPNGPQPRPRAGPQHAQVPEPPR